MTKTDYKDPGLIEAFVKTAQYLAGLNSHQDLWHHLGKFILAHFGALWSAFIERDPSGRIAVSHSTLPEATAAECLLNPQVISTIHDVMDSGFMATQELECHGPVRVVFLPVTERHQTGRVLVIAHESGGAVPSGLLNVYLAIAGLAATTSEKLSNERQLTRYRNDLEEMVKERTAEVIRAEGRNRFILDTVSEGICGIDAAGNITFINPAGAKMLGWRPEELIGLSAHRSFHHTRADGCEYQMQDCPVFVALRDGSTSYNAGEEFIRRDGSRFPVEFNVTPITDKGDLSGQVMVFRDITERRLMEEARARAKEDLERQVRERTVELRAMNEALTEQVQLKIKAEAELRALSMRVLSLQEEERRSIARELHDQVGQTLTVIKLMVGAADKTAPPELKKRLEDIAEQVIDVIRQVRSISHELRPTVLDDLGLIPGLKWLFSRLHDQVSLNIDFQCQDPNRIDPAVATAAYRIIQEALTNVMRHSGVKEARVSLKVIESRLRITVEDRGKGFEPTAVQASTGLSAMRERAILLGGRCEMQSAPGEGTTVTVEIPLS